MAPRAGVVLVGHGGVPADFPRDLLQELKRLESERLAKRQRDPSPREKELDEKIRSWPRTPETDPYKFGLENLAEDLRKQLPGLRVGLAYNEFCAPSLEQAVETLVREGAASIQILTSMFTPGGYHSEVEIPQIVEKLGRQYPSVRLRYIWPCPLDEVAALMAGWVKAVRNDVNNSSPL